MPYAPRQHFYDVITLRNTAGVLEPLQGIQVSVYNVDSSGSQTTLATIYGSRTGVAIANEFITGINGIVDFWAPPGDYNVVFTDTEPTPRIGATTHGWVSISKDLGITNAMLEDGSVTAGKLGDEAVTSAKLANGAVTNAKLGDGSVGTSKIADGSVSAPKLAAGAGSITGEMKMWTGATAPSGWQLCDGSVASSAALLAHLDTQGRPFGGGAGAGLVPDLRGRVPVGKGTHANVDTLGENEGNSLAARTPLHSHTVALPTNGRALGSSPTADDATPTTSTNGPAYIALNFIIKT